MFRVEPLNHGLAGFRLYEELVQVPHVKDYDAYEDGGPEAWPAQFDMREWGVLLASKGERCFGGAVVAFDTAGVYMLEGRRDLAVLWDIRVHPDRRRQGLGSRLFQSAVDWARCRGCRQLKVETQNVNVPACRFYVRQGCELGAIHRFGYAGMPHVAHETMLLWYLDL
jgi:GNAT superfamily N-acetyltransferase